MSGLRKSLRKGKMKKESRSMSQPTGLDEKVPGKSKKSLTYWFQPWKWKKQNSRTSVDAAVPPPDVTDNSTSSDNNATSDRTRRNSGKNRHFNPGKIINLEPSTPTKNIEKPFQDVEVETKPAIELIHQPPIVPKIVSVESSAQKSIRTITFCKTSIPDKILKLITNHNSEKPANKQKRHDQCDE